MCGWPSQIYYSHLWQLIFPNSIFLDIQGLLLAPLVLPIPIAGCRETRTTIKDDKRILSCYGQVISLFGTTEIYEEEDYIH